MGSSVACSPSPGSGVERGGRVGRDLRTVGEYDLSLQGYAPRTRAARATARTSSSEDEAECPDGGDRGGVVGDADLGEPGRVCEPKRGNVEGCVLEYGTSTTYGSSVACSPSPGSAGEAVAVSGAISGLAANTAYHFRVTATNAGGTSHGSDAVLQTLASSTPVPSSQSPAGSAPIQTNAVLAVPDAELSGATLTASRAGLIVATVELPRRRERWLCRHDHAADYHRGPGREGEGGGTDARDGLVQARRWSERRGHPAPLRQGPRAARSHRSLRVLAIVSAHDSAGASHTARDGGRPAGQGCGHQTLNRWCGASREAGVGVDWRAGAPEHARSPDASEHQAIGKTYEPVLYAVGREKIREYARDAVGESNPVHLDLDAARQAGYADLVAPPMFAVVYSSPAVGPLIFDPEIELNFAMMVHGGQDFQWGELVDRRRGDRHDGVASRTSSKRTGAASTCSSRSRSTSAESRSAAASGRTSCEECEAVADLKVGEQIPELRVTPDRYLTVRYAGASGDFEPDPCG